jgi:hypothetical protein
MKPQGIPPQEVTDGAYLRSREVANIVTAPISCPLQTLTIEGGRRARCNGCEFLRKLHRGQRCENTYSELRNEFYVVVECSHPELSWALNSPLK